MLAKALIFSGLTALAAAQSAVLTFTHAPSTVTDSQPQAITYATNDTTTPVTIILRKGPSTDLQTVSVLTSTSIGGSFIWTPDATLSNGVDYALEITQGSQINYFGPFAVQGQTATSSSSSASSSPTDASNGGAPSNATTTTELRTAPVGSLSAGTGTALPRNATMSMATLTSASASGPASNTAASTTDSGAGSQGSSTAGAASASKSSAASAELKAGSFLALLFGAVLVL